jgi:hypothetical protein
MGASFSGADCPFGKPRFFGELLLWQARSLRWRGLAADGESFFNVLLWATIRRNARCLAGSPPPIGSTIRLTLRQRMGA